MRAVRLHQYGHLPTVDSVSEPALTDANQALVRVGAAGVCRTDLHIVDGQFKDVFDVDLAYTLGHETAGWIPGWAPMSGTCPLAMPSSFIRWEPVATALPVEMGMTCIARRQPFPE